MRKVINFLDKIVIAGGYAASFLCLVLVVAVVYGVLARYIFKIASDWTTEISQYAYCGISLLATGYALLDGAHARIDIIRMRFSKKNQRRLNFIQYPIILAICIVLIWMGGQEFYNAFRNGYKSETVLGLPLWPVWSAIPLGGLLLLFAAISDCLKNLFQPEKI